MIIKNKVIEKNFPKFYNKPDYYNHSYGEYYVGKVMSLSQATKTDIWLDGWTPQNFNCNLANHRVKFCCKTQTFEVIGNGQNVSVKYIKFNKTIKLLDGFK